MICDYCGKPVDNRDSTRFCDWQCYRAYRREHPEEFGKASREYACEWCGKLVHRKPSEVRNHVYCSRSCSNKAQSATLHDHPELRLSQGIPIVCAHCGTTFYVKPNRAKKAKYCSKSCAAAARFGQPLQITRNREYSGEGNPNYKGTNNCITARRIALDAFGARCMVCGFAAVVRVHHIRLRSRGGTNALTNLVVLCPNHHAMAHEGMLSADELVTLNRAAIALLEVTQRQTHLQEAPLPATAGISP